jgi:hypothetical protein
VPAQDRQSDVHHQVFIGFRYRRHVVGGREIAEAGNAAYEFGAETGF